VAAAGRCARSLIITWITRRSLTNRRCRGSLISVGWGALFLAVRVS
jgi:hypothetical protein